MSLIRCARARHNFCPRRRRWLLLFNLLESRLGGRSVCRTVGRSALEREPPSGNQSARATGSRRDSLQMAVAQHGRGARRGARESLGERKCESSELETSLTATSPLRVARGLADRHAAPRSRAIVSRPLPAGDVWLRRTEAMQARAREHINICLYSRSQSQLASRQSVGGICWPPNWLLNTIIFRWLLERARAPCIR